MQDHASAEFINDVNASTDQETHSSAERELEGLSTC